MRVSPALLASLSLVATATPLLWSIANLPSQAADASEAVSVSEVAQGAPQVSLGRLLDGATKQNNAPELPAATPDAEPVDAPVDAVDGDAIEVVPAAAEPEADIESDAESAAEDAESVVEDAIENAQPSLPPVPVQGDGIPSAPTESPSEETDPSGDTEPFEEDTEDAIEADEASPDEAQPGDQPNGQTDGPTDGPTDGANSEAETPEEARVLVSEVDVVSTNNQPLSPELIDAVYGAVGTVPGRTTTREQLQADINSVFSTGFFSNVRANPEDTPLGVKVTFFVEPNPVLTQVDVRNRQVLTDETIDEIFSEQYGSILNLRDFQDSVLDLNDWYQENGYVLAQVTAAPQIGDDGTVTLIVAEGEIESIEVRFIDENGETTDEEGNPITGKTRDFIVTREFETQPGDVFQESAIQSDIGQAFGLGIFDDIRLSLDPGDDDPRKVKMVVNVAERDTGSIGASLGFNLRGDLFGQLSYNEDNFGGNNQKLRTEGQVTTRGDFLFDIGFTDPWIAGDPYRTSYTASLFNRRATSLIFDNGPIEVDLPNGDTPRLNRLGTGISFSRPLDDGLSLSLGAQYERVALLDSDGNVTPQDELGNLLTVSDNGRDDLLSVQFGAVLDRRDNPNAPTSGNLFRLGTEQTIPVGNGSIFSNKIRGSYSQYIPVRFFSSEAGRETFALNLQGGTVVGDLPPYEAFSLGGGNSVRGFEEGAVGAGRSFLLGTAEYRFPLFSEFLNGTLFADYGTDLGTGDSVPGNPAGVRGKPGSGFGYGAGVRVQTPLGALRLDYGLSDEGSRFHFGFGERF